MQACFQKLVEKELKAGFGAKIFKIIHGFSKGSWKIFIMNKLCMNLENMCTKTNPARSSIFHELLIANL